MTGEDVSLVFQVHVVGVWFLYALWPFSRLVHAWSIPVDFLRRSPIPYRSRMPRSKAGQRAAPARTSAD
jgi:nitrate reductase gamma subunit